MKKILYLTVPSFFDLEISLIRELSNFCDVSVLMIISPQSMRSSAFCIDHLQEKCELVNASKVTGMEKYAHLIDLKKWTIANNPDNSIWSCYKLAILIKKYIKKGDFQLIHSTTNCKTSLFLLPFISRFHCTLYTLHDPIPHNEMNKLLKWIRYDYIFRCYKRILLLSNSLERDFRANYKGKYKEIYYSQLSVYDFLQSFTPLPNTFGKYILFFGRIDNYKGVDLLIEAFPKTQAYKNGVNLIVAGKTTTGVTIDENPDNRITIINRYIDNEELASLIFHSLFIVLPYRSATQSGCVYSAYAFNKPILATCVGDLPYQVDNEIGIIVQPNSIMDLANGIDEMLKSDLQKKELLIASRYTANGDKSWRSIAQKLSDIYISIIKA